MYRLRIESFNKLPKDKRPPRDLWDKSYKLDQFLEDIWKDDKDKVKTQTYINIDDEEFE